ncbi:hypothetical protein C1I95_27055 [Micromonospora craterilacus]|uniref:Uncharacterized protein n=1 Tax=Micromonospora craterilacus TaxID=1655439 RepID=A0A2W2E386_9ACTN|nr:hypothetical protein C1I95_27055 [Micromonospora craterilacus]
MSVADTGSSGALLVGAPPGADGAAADAVRDGTAGCADEPLGAGDALLGGLGLFGPLGLFGLSSGAGVSAAAGIGRLIGGASADCVGRSGPRNDNTATTSITTNSAVPSRTTTHGAEAITLRAVSPPVSSAVSAPLGRPDMRSPLVVTDAPA